MRHAGSSLSPVKPFRRRELPKLGRKAGSVSQTSEGLEILEQPRQCHGADSVAQRERVLTGMDHVDGVELQVPQSGMHRPRRPRRVGAFELEAAPALATDHQEIQLATGVGGPEVALLRPRPEAGDHLDEGETFPGGSNLGMSSSAPFQIWP